MRIKAVRILEELVLIVRIDVLLLTKKIDLCLSETRGVVTRRSKERELKVLGEMRSAKLQEWRHLKSTIAAVHSFSQEDLAEFFYELSIKLAEKAELAGRARYTTIRSERGEQIHKLSVAAITLAEEARSLTRA